MAPPDDPRDAEIARLRATVAELLGVVADLRRQVEAQQAHIHKLVKLTFGPRGERAVGPTLFDAVPPPPAPPPTPPANPPGAGDTPASPPPGRPGHGRRPKPPDLPRERVEIDLAAAEKVCPCCAGPRIRVGQDVAERLDYRPASLFVRGSCGRRTPAGGASGPATTRGSHAPHSRPRRSPAAASGRACSPTSWWPSSSTTCRSTARSPSSPGTGG